MAAEIGRSRAGRSSRQEAKRAGSEASSRDRQAAKRAVGSVGALAGNRPATNSGGSKRASCSVPFSLKGHERHLVERHGRVRLQEARRSIWGAGRKCRVSLQQRQLEEGTKERT